VEVLVKDHQGAFLGEDIGRGGDTCRCADWARYGYFLIPIINPLERVGAHPEPVANNFVIPVYPGVSEEIIEGASECIAFAALGVLVVIFVGPARFVVELCRVHQSPVSQDVDMRGEINQVVPVGLRECPDVTIWGSCLVCGPGHLGFDLWADTVRVCYGYGTDQAQGAGYLVSLVIEPLQGLGCGILVWHGLRIWMKGDVPGIPGEAVNILITLDGIGGRLCGPGGPGWPAGGTGWAVTVVGNYLGWVLWVFRASDNEAGFIAVGIGFPITWGGFYRL